MDSDELSGKVAVVTGATRGLGRAIVETFARRGARVVLSSRSERAVAEAVSNLRNAGFTQVIGVACDVRSSEQVEALAARAVNAFGTLDIWVNNAGISAPYGRTIDVPVDAFVAATETNVLGTYHGSRVALRHLLPKGYGKLINVVGRGARGPVPMQTAYGSSKAWVRNFTRALAKEHRRSGVDIFAFQPGLMLTDLVMKPEAVAGYEAQLAPLATVLKMWGEPPEVAADKVAWLASGKTDRRRAVDASTHGALWMLGGPVRALLGKRSVDLQPRTHPRPE